MRRMALALLLWLSAALAADGRFPEQAHGFGGFLESTLGSVVLTPSFKWGYRVTGINLNVPLQRTVAPGKFFLFGIDGLDASLKSSPMMVASGRLAAQLGDWYFFVAAEAAGPRKATARCDQHPMMQKSGLNAAVEMTDSSLRGWLVEGGTGFEIFDTVILFTGLRRDEIAATLRGPRLEGGTALLPATSSDALDGDLLARLWIPYLGINLSGSRFSGSLAYSPFAAVQLQLPWKRADQENQVGETAVYSFQTPGVFLEGKCDGDVKVRGTFDLGVWVKGTWMRFSGRAVETLKQTMGDPPPDTQASGSGSSTISRYEMSLGLTAAMVF